MGAKRSYSEHKSGGESTSRPESDFSRQANKKQRRGNFNPRQRDADGELDHVSYGKVKKRARDIQRLLQKKDNLPADVRNNLEQELAGHDATIYEHDFRKKRSKMIGRYHKIRFFERQKAERMVKKLNKRLAETTDAEEMVKLKSDLHIAEVDVAYARYAPLLEPYCAMYPKRRQEEEAEAEQPKEKVRLDTPRPPLWKTVEETMEQGVARLEKLRDRRDAFERARNRGKGPKPPRAAGGGSGAKEGGAESGSDDGGFFEEA